MTKNSVLNFIKLLRNAELLMYCS